VLCYLGQGANALRDPSTISAPLYSLVPQGSFLLYPLIVLATSATIIASQALITSVFSLTNQGIRLGFFPRVTVLHTSSTHEGQIYVPIMNWGLAICCILLVVIFGKSSELAAAYGLAVSGTMLITSLVYFLVIRYTWGWSGWKAYPLLAVFLLMDAAFLGANLLKFFEGGYIPVVVGVVIFIAMANWRMGRLLLADHFQSDFRPLEGFTRGELCADATRVPGTAVFMASQADGVPPVLTRMVDRFHVLQQNVILLTVIGDHVPRVAPENKVRTEKLGNGFYRVLVRVGFMEMPHVPRKLKVALGELDLDVDPEEIIYVLGHETFVVQSRGRMSQFNQSLFAFLSRNARNATDYFRIPPRQVIELGAQIKL
jgi:KUP system potassium uptake protein